MPGERPTWNKNFFDFEYQKALNSSTFPKSCVEKAACEKNRSIYEGSQ